MERVSGIGNTRVAHPFNLAPNQGGPSFAFFAKGGHSMLTAK
jgi:hypothetical protein